MSAPKEYFEELARDLLKVKSPQDRDMILDEWYDAQHRATDYDAIEWGFNPKTWMYNDRREMEVRIANARRSQVNARR